jgi:hypothetical protein
LIEEDQSMKNRILAPACVLLGFSLLADANQVGIVTSEESLNAAYTGKGYSPYAERDFPTFPLWGETHLHTGLSMDAGLFGNSLGLEEAYRFARGEQVTTSTGQPAKLARPLDWIVITDHSDMMGFVFDIKDGDPVVVGTEQGARWHKMMNGTPQEGVEAALDLITTFSNTRMDPKLVEAYAPGSAKYSDIWEQTIAAADQFNDPGQFTALIGFEWTSLVRGGNMHRNVIFRDNADKVSQVAPFTQTPPFGSPNPLDLYNYLEHYEKKTGGTVLAIAHNGNLSNGIMFPVDAQYDGRKLDKTYVEARNRWEPLYEVTQIKGDGETHPLLSPDDEFADYETWDVGNLDLSIAKTDDMLQYEYAREALKNGLLLEERLGTNPYKFGLVGATDSHTSLSTPDEDNFFGKHTGYEPSPERISHPFMKNENGELFAWQQVASGLQAVYSRDNTREGVFDAMQRKETYATTGTRMMVRFFGGWEFKESDLDNRQPAFTGYEKGVPMGGDLKSADGAEAPTFMVYALRDPVGANLDRIQIVKGWTDNKGNTQEKVHNVAWSGDRKLDRKGKLPPVGNTVDIEKANWTNTIGASELKTVWEDPDFDPAQRAFYYARVLEIPTPRWIVYDAFRYDTDIPADATTIGQERAYTSPIWYNPPKG